MPELKKGDSTPLAKNAQQVVEQAAVDINWNGSIDFDIFARRMTPDGQTHNLYFNNRSQVNASDAEPFMVLSQDQRGGDNQGEHIEVLNLRKGEKLAIMVGDWNKIQNGVDGDLDESDLVTTVNVGDDTVEIRYVDPEGGANLASMFEVDYTGDEPIITNSGKGMVTAAISTTEGMEAAMQELAGF